MQGARSAATAAYQVDRQASEHRATPQMAHRSSFSTACLSRVAYVYGLQRAKLIPDLPHLFRKLRPPFEAAAKHHRKLEKTLYFAQVDAYALYTI